MRPKTIFMIILIVLLVVMILQAAGSLTLFSSMSRTSLALVIAALAFVLGFMTARPSRHPGVKQYMRDNEDSHPDTLSDEDREYIN